MAVRSRNETLALVAIVLVGLVVPLGGILTAVILSLTMFRDNPAMKRSALIVGLGVTVVELVLFGLAVWGLQPQ